MLCSRDTINAKPRFETTVGTSMSAAAIMTPSAMLTFAPMVRLIARPLTPPASPPATVNVQPRHSRTRRPTRITSPA
jgi:hypothetical protein